MQRRQGRGWVLALAAVMALGCRKSPVTSATADGGAASTDPVPEPGFTVRTDSTDVVFSWFDAQGQSHAVTRAEEVPEAARELVRVDPSRPELRRPGWIWMTNLHAPGAGGALPLRAVRSESLATVLLARVGQEGPLGSTAPAPAADSGAATAHGPSQVIVYGASWCSACHQAAAYLTRRHVAFVEKDIEQDAAAAQEMREKAQRAGVATGSIPILDVRGHVMVGFSPEAIDRALAGG
jgi:glutaredoxin